MIFFDKLEWDLRTPLVEAEVYAAAVCNELGTDETMAENVRKQLRWKILQAKKVWKEGKGRGGCEGIVCVLTATAHLGIPKTVR
jgi:hypothetical protein